MPNYNSTLQSNNTDLQTILDSINALPEAGGVELPELTNEGTAADLLSGKELIDGNGQVITGSFSIDEELTTQDDLIAQIQAAVNSLPGAGSGSGSIETITIDCTNKAIDPGAEIIYLDETMTLRRELLSKRVYTIMKNSIFATSGYMSTTLGDYSSIIGNTTYRIFFAD